MVNVILDEKAKVGVFFVSQRHFDFFSCKTKTSLKFSKCELKTFRF